MRYKGLLLDIDNTLYDYNITHNIAFDCAINYVVKKYEIKNNIVLNAFAQARASIHMELKETASSHNRLLYFQRMCEVLKLNPLVCAMPIYNIYWDTFIDNIELFDGVERLLKRFEKRICLVTDLTAHIQYRKIEKMGISKYIHSIVTSEEAGREKPHPYMFMLALHKLGLTKESVCMIGDSFSKDIQGALDLGIDAYWLNFKKEYKEEKKQFHEVEKFSDLLDKVV